MAENSKKYIESIVKNNEIDKIALLRKREEDRNNAIAFVEMWIKDGRKTTIAMAIKIGEELNAIRQTYHPHMTFRAFLQYYHNRSEKRFEEISYKTAAGYVRLALKRKILRAPFTTNVTLSGLIALAGEHVNDEVITRVEKRILASNKPDILLSVDDINEMIRATLPPQSKGIRKPRAPRLADLADDATPLIVPTGKIHRSVTKADIRGTLSALASHIKAGDQEAIEMMRQFVSLPVVKSAMR